MTTNTAPQSGKGHEDFEFINIKKFINFTYTWTIKDFEKDTINWFCYKSPIFSNETDSEIKWRLKIENEKSNKTVCYVKLCFISSNVKKIQSNCKFTITSLLPITDDKFKTYASTIEFTSEKFSTCIVESTSVLKDLARGHLVFSDRSSMQIVTMHYLKVNCLIDVLEISTILTIPKCTLADNLKLMFENRKLSDVTLCVSGKEFKAHKAILAVRSPVFSAMFEHEMEEKKNNRVDITDIDAEVFEEFLRYIYTGEVLNLENFASGLLLAAEKYGFEKLKVLCGSALYSNISLENAAEVLVLTDMCNLDQFKAAAMGFIGAHVEEVCKTTGWISMEQSHQHLITEVLRHVSKQLHNKMGC